MKLNSKIFLISGPSGVGKDTIIVELRKIFHTELLMMTLHHHNTREKMMNMLNTSGNPSIHSEYGAPPESISSPSQV